MKLLSIFLDRSCEFIEPKSCQGGGQGPHKDTPCGQGVATPPSLVAPGGSSPMSYGHKILFTLEKNIENSQDFSPPSAWRNLGGAFLLSDGAILLRKRRLKEAEGTWASRLDGGE